MKRRTKAESHSILMGEVFRLYMAVVQVITVLIMLVLDAIGVVGWIKQSMHYLFRSVGADEKLIPLVAIVMVFSLLGALLQISSKFPKLRTQRSTRKSK
jgi:uncharacterized integral membrane protein